MSHFVHLVSRFARSLRARRPDPSDQEFVASLLRPPEAEVFWKQPVPDLDHALRGAVWLAAEGRPDLAGPFLLHDIGKRHARLGTIGRSFVTALALVHLPVGRRGRAYLDHAAAGAAELALLGSSEITVAFARHHHSSRSPGPAAADWDLLVAADRR